MDKAVLAAYGWDDINPTCEFILDYEEEEEETPKLGGEGGNSTRSRKKPYRYRWTEDTHDEVLTRLLALNKERHEEELMGMAEVEKSTAKGKKTGGKKRKKPEKKADRPEPIITSKQLSLIPPDPEQLEL